MRFKLTASRELRGEWWVPGHRHEAATGVLSCHPARGAWLRFDLPGAQRVLAKAGPARMLLGASDDGLPLTLLDCQSGIDAEILVGTAVGGLHFEQGAATISRLSFGFPGLALWLGQGMSRPATGDPSPDEPMPLASFRPLEVTVKGVRIVGEHCCGVEPGPDQTVCQRGFKLTMNHMAPETLDRSCAMAMQLIELAAVCLGRTVVPAWFEIGSCERHAWLWRDMVYENDRDVEVVGTTVVPLQVLSGKPSIDFQHWLDVYSKVSHVLDYVRAVRSPRLNLSDARLLILSFALEGLHRTIHAQEQHCSIEEFATILRMVKPTLRQALKDAYAPKLLRERIYQAIGHSYELSFAERIRSLSEFVSSYVDLPALRWSDDEIAYLKGLRNQLTHPGIGADWRQADRRKQLRLTSKSHQTIRARLMAEIGVPAEVARPAILQGMNDG